MIQHVKFIPLVDLIKEVDVYNIVNDTDYKVYLSSAYPDEYTLVKDRTDDAIPPEEFIDFILQHFPDEKYFEEGDVLLENIRFYIDPAANQCLLYWEVDEKFV